MRARWKYYAAVMTPDGIKFITKSEGWKEAVWEPGEEAKAFPKAMAEAVCENLNLDMDMPTAMVVKAPKDMALRNDPVETNDRILSLPIQGGVLTADAELQGETNHNSIFLSFTPEGKDKTDLARVHDVDGSDNLVVEIFKNDETYFSIDVPKESRRYVVEYCYEDNFPVTVCETDSLETALSEAKCFTPPEGWNVDEEDPEASVCMVVRDQKYEEDPGFTVFWINTEGKSGSDAKPGYPGYDLIMAGD